MKKNVLEIDSIQKHFNYKILLSDIYIKCETGNIIGLLGRNGSGKSTLFKIIFGIEDAENKFIRINDIVKEKNYSLLKEISYLPQNNFIPIQLSIKKAISLSIKKDQHNLFYNDENIESIKEKYIHQLSGGELRYLEIKIILFNKSKFILLDEPYNGLSPISIQKINNLIVDNSKRKGIIITDHNYVEIIKIATEIILLKDGKTNSVNNINDLKEKGYLTLNN